ncbi:hypothetical protein COO91_06432 [Nostoc flagelliforme CCNUN1]|uniref:Uncharacterized protein n=1 Tax=Nostoc flagelliforme CCNUN1 TaxID=2038116 RepID=A0A2K8SY94_9NOSO|nr:hypothetical protein COO91_06432 [Nostoc flagelliforme CCNUN1]
MARPQARTASPMPNDGSCSTWGDPKTALPPQCPLTNNNL